MYTRATTCTGHYMHVLTLNPPVRSISLSPTGLLPTMHTRAFMDAYRLSTVVAMATRPSTTLVPPTEDSSVRRGCGWKNRMPENPHSTAPKVREAPDKCTPVLWTKVTGVMSSDSDRDSYREYSHRKKLVKCFYHSNW